MFKKQLKRDARVAVCIDAGKIAVARVRYEKDLPPCLDICELQDIQDDSATSAEIARLASQHDLRQYECLSSLVPGDYHLLLVEAPNVQAEELPAAIRWRVKDLIDFHIDDAVVDVFEVPAQKTTSKNRMMYAIVARSNRVHQIIKQLGNAGLHLEIIDIPELALRNIASMLPEDDIGVALVYVGQHQGVITITRQSTLYLSRVINIGTSSLPGSVTDIMENEACQQWLDNIIIEAQRSMDYYESHFLQPQVSALVMVPTGKAITGITDYLSRQLQLPVRILDINQLMDVRQTIPEEVQADCMLAIGTALR